MELACTTGMYDRHVLLRRAHSGNIQGAFREIQGTFREHSRNILVTFREH
jgi:hypothetical protein